MEMLGMTSGQRRSVSEPLGVWLIGARGAVATTTIVGAIALRRGHTGSVAPRAGSGRPRAHARCPRRLVADQRALRVRGDGHGRAVCELHAVGRRLAPRS